MLQGLEKDLRFACASGHWKDTACELLWSEGREDCLKSDGRFWPPMCIILSARHWALNSMQILSQQLHELGMILATFYKMRELQLREVELAPSYKGQEAHGDC